MAEWPLGVPRLDEALELVHRLVVAGQLCDQDPPLTFDLRSVPAQHRLTLKLAC